MANIDEKYLTSLLGRIELIRNELSALEGEIREALTVPEPAGATEPDEVPEPAGTTAQVEVVEPVEPVAEDIPIDISISDIEMPVPPVVEPADSIPAPEPVEIPVQEPVDIQVQVTADLPAEEPVEEPTPRKPILDSAKADTAVMDVMAEKQAWRTDRPGMPVKNIISAISLNDRVLLINVLFKEDPLLFQETIAKFNAMSSLGEALGYIAENYPDWDMNSEPVYRLMMAVRRKLS